MHFGSSIKGRHIDLSSKAKGGYKFIIIIIQGDIAYFMQSLLVLTPFCWSNIMQRSRLVLISIACSKVNAENHRHLHTAG
jgi:hypothetical protein